MPKLSFRSGQKFGVWTLVSRIGRGGHGEVWKVRDSSGNTTAMKLLMDKKSKAYLRFRNEIRFLQDHPSLPGVLPILDSDLPDISEPTPPWYVMPLATPLSTYLDGASPEKITSVIGQLANALAQLHSKQISHRDIKPANLFWYDGLACFGDFGLVDYPDKHDLTVKNESVGPRWTRSPEMERDATAAAGAPADVYSLAKTLWIFLTGQSTAFEGQYSPSVNASGSIGRFNYSRPLERLLAAATSNSPRERPSASDFSTQLADWIAMNAEWEQYNPLQWKEILDRLFPESAPSRAIWTRLPEIVRVLNIVADYPDLNHTFFPSGGGQDLDGVVSGAERGTIELDFGLPHILRPKRLLFESFPYDAEWNYFRLECHPLAPILSAKERDRKGFREEVVELETGERLGYHAWEERYDAGEIDEVKYRRVIRCLSGSFVMFAKSSTYNINLGTYDARHQQMSASEFRKYIHREARRLTTNRR
jgi:serine/threonine protein kinase